MSHRFVAGYFPHVTRTFPRWFLFLFPDEVQCPEVIVFDTIRNPSLAIFALCGIGIGARGAFRTLNTTLWWRTAFAFFGFMNLVALLLHCLVTPSSQTTSAAQDFPLLWFLDCLFTGMSSFAIMGACFETLVESARVWQTMTLTIGSVTALLAAILFCQRSVTMGAELYYLLPLILAGTVCLLTNFKDFRGGTVIILLGGLLCGAGILFDPFLCRSWVSYYHDPLTAPSLMFAGCDVSFVGIGMWIESVYGKETSEKHNKHD